MDEIIEDIKKIEKDTKEIRCSPIVNFFKDCLKCLKHCIFYFCKSKT